MFAPFARHRRCAQSEEQAALPAAKELGVSGVRVLVVDDEPLIASLVCTVLEEEGYEPICSCSASEALAEIDGADNFDAVITDIDLGGPVDGFEIARRARIHRPDAAVIYISGAAAARVPVERVIGSKFVGKPFTPYQLAEVLRLTLQPD